jgi:hypothetical protein
MSFSTPPPTRSDETFAEQSAPMIRYWPFVSGCSVRKTWRDLLMFACGLQCGEEHTTMCALQARDGR